MATEYTHGKVLQTNIEDEMKRSYIDYAMSVITTRALPDVRDGLKPVHRRILYSMHETGILPDKKYSKSAGPVGDVLGKYHPHGDSIVYDALVRMAQDFSLRYPLIDGHGNFGSIDGDPAAAMRYTEVRLTKMAMEMLRDLDKNTVDFQPNFDESKEEPRVLPSRFPNLLANGSAGIAVGMATNIPPHNLTEVIDGCILMIDDPEVSVEQLMKVIKGPDFPTGGLIIGREGIKDAYTTGRGLIKTRAEAKIEVMANGRNRIVITELPYQVNKAKLIERIAELVREKKIEGITDLRDETDRTGLRVVIDLKRDANANVILNQLYKYTQMHQTFGVTMLALVEGQPRVLNLREVLYYYLEHQKDVVTRRTKFELEKAEERAHILEGLRIALDHIDAVIALIRASQTVEEAREGLMASFGLSERQAQAILDMRLQRLTGLERDKIEEEYAELRKTIEYLRAVLANEQMLLGIIRRELLEIKEKFGDERRTKITHDEGEMDMEDLIAEEDVVITVTHQNYIKRMPADTYRSQRRGGRGVTGMGTKEEDFVEQIFITTTHHYVLFFTNFGKVHRLKVYEIPEASRQSKGTNIINLLQIEPGESVTAVIPIREYDPDHYLIFATKRGTVKKTGLAEYDSPRRGGIIAITLDEGDELIAVKLTNGRQEAILVTRYGMSIRFHEDDVRPMGRAARGVRGISLEGDDTVVGMEILNDGEELVMVTDAGFGKRTPLDEYRRQSRGGKGVKTITLTRKNGILVGAKVVKEGNELMLITAQGVLIRFPVRDISVLSRYAQGVTLMRPDEGDSVVALAQVVSKDDE